MNLDRFRREIQVAARLQHPHIVPVIATGECGGLPWYSMPFVEGESLRARIDACHPERAERVEGSASSPARMPLGDTIVIMRDVARALAYAHERGIVHRDIKPDNVLLSGGSAMVADFGIAKALSAARLPSDADTLTQLGTSIGTPAYMAPEQAAGDPAVDHRADIYAFGCVAYELLAGRPPFADRAPQRMLAARMLAREYSNWGIKPAETADLLSSAMRYRDRLSETRRLYLVSQYYRDGPLSARNADSAKAAIDTVIARFPDAVSLQLAGMMAAGTGQPLRADSLFRRSAAMDSTYWYPLRRLLVMQLDDGRLAARRRWHLCVHQFGLEDLHQLGRRAGLAMASTARGLPALRSADAAEALSARSLLGRRSTFVCVTRLRPYV